MTMVIMWHLYYNYDNIVAKLYYHWCQLLIHSRLLIERWNEQAYELLEYEPYVPIED